MKAIQVKLTDGRDVLLHEITLSEFGLFLAAMPMLQNMGKLLSGEAGDFDPEAQSLIPLWRLVARCTDLTVEDLLGLSFVDGIGLLTGLGELLPKNFTPPALPETT